MSDVPLESIIKAVVRRDAEAFRVLYDHLESKIFTYVIYRTPERDTAIDVTQDIFVELYEALSTFLYQSDAQFYSFVFTIVKRKLARFYNNKHTKAVKDRVTGEEEFLAATDASAQELLAVRQALDTLDETAREIIILHHWSRYSFGEIAAMLTMTEGAVRTRHHRALATLKPLLTSSPTI